MKGKINLVRENKGIEKVKLQQIINLSGKIKYPVQYILILTNYLIIISLLIY